MFVKFLFEMIYFKMLNSEMFIVMKHYIQFVLLFVHTVDSQPVIIDL